MYYCTYKGRTVDVLKCARCRAYSLTLAPTDSVSDDEGWVLYSFTCQKCGAGGAVRLSSEVALEAFLTWEALQERIDELKAVMSITDLR